MTYRKRRSPCAYLERKDIGVVGPEGAILHPGFRAEGTGSGEFRRRYDIAAVGLFHRGDGIQRRRHPDADSNSDAHRSPRVPARLQPTPGVGGCAPHGVLMVIPRGWRGSRWRALGVVHNSLISVSLGEGALAGAHRGPPLLLMLRGLGSQTELRGESTPEDRVGVMGEVLEKHRPVYRGYSLEKTIVHGVCGSRGPSAPERGQGRGQGAAALLSLVLEAQPGQDRRLHRPDVSAAV